jgi:tRNA A37 threonylcarbamoyladenosine modification protein TsaB
MGEVYWGLFADGQQPVAAAHGGERLSAPQAMPGELAGMLPVTGFVRAGAGMGFGAWPELAGMVRAGGACLSRAEPHAVQIAWLARADLALGAVWLDPAAAQPVYLRDRVAQIPKAGPAL